MDAYGVTVPYNMHTSSGVHQPIRPCTFSCLRMYVVSVCSAPQHQNLTAGATAAPVPSPCTAFICRRERSLKGRYPVARAEADDGAAVGLVAGGFSFSRMEAGKGVAAGGRAATARAGAFPRAFPPRPDVVARGLAASGAPAAEA